jgi:hypothetical protein
VQNTPDLPNPLEHEEHVKKVLERLRQAGLQVDIKKSSFSVKSSTFLLAPMYLNALLPAVASLSVNSLKKYSSSRRPEALPM